MSTEPQRAGDPESRPFFLVGALRSGTTLLRLLLGHHPRICRCEEFEFVASAIAGQSQWPDLAAYREELPYRLDVRLSGIAPIPEARDFPDLAHQLLLRLAQADGSKLVGATVHHHFDELPRLWAQARFIYLERDPRDVARSCVQQGWAGNAWSAVPIWQAARATWLRLRATLPSERYIEVKYERLVEDAEPVLSRIAGFLGLEYDPAMLNIDTDSTYKRPDPGLATSWRTESNEREIREMESRLGPDLEDAGYPPSGLPRLGLGPLDELRLRLDDRLGKIRLARRRYGTLPWFAAVIGRRLPYKALRRRAQLRIDEIRRPHLK